MSRSGHPGGGLWEQLHGRGSGAAGLSTRGGDGLQQAAWI